MIINLSWSELSHSYFFLAQHIWKRWYVYWSSPDSAVSTLKDICEHQSKVENIKITVLLTNYNEVVSVEYELTKHQFTYLQLKYAAIA